jgi:hypothetical protein
MLTGGDGRSQFGLVFGSASGELHGAGFYPVHELCDDLILFDPVAALYEDGFYDADNGATEFNHFFGFY